MKRDTLKALYGIGALRRLYRFRLPNARAYGKLLGACLDSWGLGWDWLKNVLVYDPLLRAKCDRVGRGVVVQGSFPLIQNDGRIEVGDRVVFGGMNNLIVGLPVAGREGPAAELVIGDDTAIGFFAEINVASAVRIGNRVRLATGVMIFDNNSHPIAPAARREGLPMTADDVADVVIEDDVWVGTNAMVLKGVRIGRGSVVGAASVVTKDVPPGVVVVGNPARVARRIEASDAAPAAAREREGGAPPVVR